MNIKLTLNTSKGATGAKAKITTCYLGTDVSRFYGYWSGHRFEIELDHLRDRDIEIVRASEKAQKSISAALSPLIESQVRLVLGED